MTSPILAAIEQLRASKTRWGSYAVDHDAIDALTELLETIAVHARRNHGAGVDCDGVCIDDIARAAEALAEAITHRSPA